VSTHKQWGSASGNIGGRFVLPEGELQVLRQVVAPIVELGIQSRHLLQGEFMGSSSWIVFLENLGKDAGAPEESQSA
jgi:hypothetical protein